MPESRWRREQQARRRRLTLRGRITILGGVLLIGAALARWLAPAWVPSGAHDPDPSGSQSLPPVSAGAPPARSGRAATPPEQPPDVPREVVERLPISRAALELPALAPSPLPSRPGEDPHGRLYESVDVANAYPQIPGPLRVEYTLDAELTRHVFRVLRKARVALGNVVLLDPTSGRVLAYAATDVERFSPTRSYPAASLVKVITAAAALRHSPQEARLPCRYRGSPYRLTPSRIDPPRNGHIVSLRQALATSNNQCFAQLAVHAVGAEPLLESIERFGWLSPPAPAHAAGSADLGEDRFDVGKLGSGLDGCRITPLHAAQLAATLVHGEVVAPRWIERVVDAGGRELSLPPPPAPRQVLAPALTTELRSMLVDTTVRGTARSAFHPRRGRPLLGPVRVAGKTGSLSGKNPDGRYEWFVGVAPADGPRVAVAVVLVQSDLWWRNASQVAADVLRGVFCRKGHCSAEHASRWVRVPDTTAALAAPVSDPPRFN